VDVFCSAAFAKVYTSKMPITACDLLYERVLPFYDELDVEVGAVLTDNGREFCGRPEQHPYELLLGERRPSTLLFAVPRSTEIDRHGAR